MFKVFVKELKRVLLLKFVEIRFLLTLMDSYLIFNKYNRFKYLTSVLTNTTREIRV